MSQSDDLRRENEALRARAAALNAAILRINASLDLDAVLGEVVESARALTGARYGFIATVDEPGAPGGFVHGGNAKFREPPDGFGVGAFDVSYGNWFHGYFPGLERVSESARRPGPFRVPVPARRRLLGSVLICIRWSVGKPDIVFRHGGHHGL